MFIFAALLILWSFMRFGAVLPTDSLLILTVWVIALCSVSGGEIIKRKRLDYLGVAALILSGALISSGAFPLAIWALAVFWSWKATRDHPEHVLRFLRFCLVLGLAEAALGLIQYFVAPGWIFGYQNSNGSLISGTLINRNHFAGVLEMIIPSCIALAFMTARRYGDPSRSYLYMLAASFMGLALVFSLSRMGIFTLLLTALFICILLIFRRTERNLGIVLGFGFIALLIAGIVWIGLDVVINRYIESKGPNAIVENIRTSVFRDSLRMIKAFPQGVGIGRYQDVFRRFQTQHTELLFDHAHNDYLESAAEWGVAPAILFWSLVGVLFVRFVRKFLRTGSHQGQATLLSCIGAMFAILVHSFVDFNLQIPSNAILFFTFIGVGLGTVFPKVKLRASGGRDFSNQQIVVD